MDEQMPLVLTTERLILRPLTRSDALFIKDLLNEPSFLRYIGDKQVRSIADAERYLEQGPIRSYADHGFGLLLVLRQADQVPMGICGLVKRDGLNHPDLGFAFQSDFWGVGYAFEAAEAVLHETRDHSSIPHLLGITLPENTASIRLLERLGFVYKIQMKMNEEDGPLNIYQLPLL